MNRNHCLLLAILGGCTTTTSKVDPVMTEVDASTPEGVEVASAIGEGTVEVPIRLINAYGASVPGGVASVSVSGATATLADDQVSIDSDGYGVATVTTSGAEAFTLTVTSTDAGTIGGAEGQSWSLGGSLYGLQLDYGASLPGAVQNPEFAVAGTHGMALASGSEVWWVPGEAGAPAHRVASLPFNVAGMWSAQIDGDGVADLVLWGSDTAVTLRGRRGGGYAWGGAWTADSGDVVGIAAADLDGDRRTDLAVAMSGEVTAEVQILTGDGSWGFTPTAVLDLNYAIRGVAAADEGEDGDPDVTVLTSSTGVLRRYTLGESGWVGASWPELDDFDGGDGSLLLPMADLDDNGTPDLLIVGPTGSSQQLTFYTMGDSVTVYPLAFSQVNATVADIDASSPDELIVLDSEALNIFVYQGAESSSTFRQRKLSLTEDLGPIAVSDANSDGVADVGLATELLSWFSGTLDSDDGWDPATTSWRSYAASLSGPRVFVDLDGDGMLDFVHLSDASDTTLKVWSFVLDGSDIKLRSGESESLGGSTAESLAVCEDGADFLFWAVTSSGTDYTLHALRYDPGTGALSTIDSTSVTGSLVTCGRFESGGLAAVASANGAWVTYELNADTLETTGKSGSAGTAYALAAADLEGTGFDDVVACDSSGCSIAAGDTDGDGEDEVIVGGSSVSLWDGDEERVLSGQGVVSLVDADGDGLMDVLVSDEDSGRFWIYQGVNGEAPPPVVLHTTREFHGLATLGDVSGDGVPELVVEGSDGAVIHTTASTGVLR